MDPRPVSFAADNHWTVQSLWDILRGRYFEERRHPALKTNADVARALEDVIRCKGAHAVKAAKVKAHVDPADPWRKWLGDEGLHRGNDRADEAAKRGVEAHPRQLRVLVGVMKERGVAYLGFLARLATFMDGRGKAG